MTSARRATIHRRIGPRDRRGAPATVGSYISVTARSCRKGLAYGHMSAAGFTTGRPAVAERGPLTDHGSATAADIDSQSLPTGGAHHEWNLGVRTGPGR